jgi:putative oxidoreductase
MRIASVICRYLLGVAFSVFGLNGFVQFISPAPPPPLAGQFLGALVASHYMVPVFALQLVCGLLFLSGRFIPLALTLIAPVIVNILLYHATMDPGGSAPGLVVAACWFVVFLRYRSAFAGIVQQREVQQVG